MIFRLRYLDAECRETRHSFLSLLRVNVVTFSTLLQVLLTELQHHEDEDTPNNRHGSGSAKLTAVTRRVLPGLRHYSSWLVSNAVVLVAELGDASLDVRIQELWVAYAKAMTILVSTFPVAGLPPPLGYLLDEDEDTLAFKPLDNQDAQRRYYDEVTGYRKPKWHDRGIHRQHPNIEMLGRIRDLLTDGMLIQSREVSTPCQVIDDSDHQRMSLFACLAQLLYMVPLEPRAHMHSTLYQLIIRTRLRMLMRLLFHRQQTLGMGLIHSLT